MKQVQNMRISQALICLICINSVCVCAVPVLNSELNLNLNLNPSVDNDKVSSFSVPITLEPIVTRAGDVETQESNAAQADADQVALESSIIENLDSSGQPFQSHESVIVSTENPYPKETKEGDAVGQVEKYDEDQEKEKYDDDDDDEESGHKYKKGHLKDEDDGETETDEEEEEEDEEETDDDEEKYNDFDDEDYEDLYASEFEDEYDKHHYHHDHHQHDLDHGHNHNHDHLHGHEHGHMGSHIDIHGHEKGQMQVHTSSHDAHDDCGYLDGHSESMDHHFLPVSGPPPPPPPTPSPQPIKGSIDYVLIPMILIGLFGPLFTFLFVLLGCLETKMPLPTSRSITIEDAPFRDSALSSDFDAEKLGGSISEVVKSIYEKYDGCSQKLVCTTASYARRWSLVDLDRIPEFSSIDYMVKNLPRTIRRHFKAFKWALRNPNADCDVFKCQLSLFS